MDQYANDVLLEKDAEFERYQEMMLRMTGIEKRQTAESLRRSNGSRNPRPDKTANAEHNETAGSDQSAEKKLQDKAQKLANYIEELTKQLKRRRAGMKIIRALDFGSRPALAAFDPSTSERFSRAETAAERRMYRALAAFTGIRSQRTSNLLPEPKSKN